MRVPDAVRGDLRGVFFLDEDTGWSCGDDGVLLAWDSNEDEWIHLNPGEPVYDNSDPSKPAGLWDIHMIDILEGYVVGYDGTIAFTDDGWESWSTPDNLPEEFTGEDPHDIYDVHAFDDENIILCGDYGEIWRIEVSPTATTWDLDIRLIDLEGLCPALFGHSNLELWSMSFDAPNNPASAIWAAGGVGTNQGYLFRWEGTTWQQVTCYRRDPVSCYLPTLYGVSVLDTQATTTPEACIAAYASTVYGWESATPNVDPCGDPPCSGATSACLSASHILNQRSVFDPDIPNPPLAHVARISDTDACLVGRSGIIRLFEPLETLSIRDVGTLEWERIRDGDFLNGEKGCVAREYLAIDRTINGGRAWSEAMEPTPPVNGVAYNWWALDFGGSNGQKVVVAGDGGRFAYSDDEGANWSEIDFMGSTTILAAAFAPGSNTVYATGVEGNFYRSFDAGETWDEAASPSSSTSLVLNGVSFSSVLAGVGYVVGIDPPFAAAYKTTNAGSSWTSVSLSGGTARIAFRDVATWGSGTHAIVVGDGGGVYETNSSGTLVRITDFGSVPAPTATLLDVEVLNNGEDVVITGDKGTVLFRNGSTWSSPKSQTSGYLVRGSFQSETHGFILGSDSIVCEYD